MKKILTPVLFFALLQLTQAQVDRDVPRAARDQVINDDLIVTGSECLGFDCVNGESFGFETLRLKENNLRLRFWDTSNSASFPTRDWELQANETTNGGAEKFSIFDVDAGRTPFTVRGNAINNALYIATGGKVGFGTSTPVVELHVRDGDSPTLRLEQDGSNGFTQQTWDLASNEANFFIRDVTNGSKLPFKIKPGAPTSSLFVAANGSIGMGTESLDAALHVRRTDASVNELFHIEGAGTVFNRFESSDGGAVQVYMTTNVDNNRRLIGQDNSGVIQSQIALKNGGIFDFYPTMAATFSRLTAGSTGLTSSSSRSLKDNIEELDIPNVLDRISKVPVTSYNWKRQIVGEEIAKREVIGLIAQDFYSVLERGKDTEINGQDVQMALWMGVQQLHENDLATELVLEEKENRIADLEEQVSRLEGKLDEISELLIANSQDILLNAGDKSRLGQNFPNPYEGETKIEYYIPEKARHGEIRFTDVSGKLIKKVPIQSMGKGQITLSVRDLSQGNYHYTLVVDGEVIDTKVMVLSR